MKWILIIVIMRGYTQTPTLIEGFSEQGCKIAAEAVRRSQEAWVTCVEKK